AQATPGRTCPRAAPRPKCGPCRCHRPSPAGTVTAPNSHSCHGAEPCASISPQSPTPSPGRPGGCPPGLPQIRTCPIKAYGSSSHGFAPSLRYPRPFRGQGAEARCPRPGARRRVRDPALPSLRRVLAGRVPRLPRYYEGLRLLPPRLPGLLCSPGDTPAASPFAPPAPDAATAAWGFRVRQPLSRWKGRGRAAGLSGCWGTLVDVRRVLGPRRAPSARPVTAPGHGPSARSDGGRATRSLLSGLDSTAFALAVYASPCQSPGPTQDSLLAVGQLDQVGLVTHRVPMKGFRLLFLLSQPIRTQERPRSAAAGASVSYELPETNHAPAVCCSGWFGGPFERGTDQRPPLFPLSPST